MTMPEHVCDGEDLHTDLTHLHEALTVTRSEALADPRNQVEGLDQAACGPHLKHLAELAAAAAAGWRLRPRLARRRPRSGRTVGGRAVGQRGDLHAPSRPLAMETLTAPRSSLEPSRLPSAVVGNPEDPRSQRSPSQADLGQPRASLPTGVAAQPRDGGTAGTEPPPGTRRAQIMHNGSSADASHEILHHVTAAATPHVTESRAQRIRAGVSGLHPGYFALVMATGIMSIGTSTAGVGWLSLSLLWLAVICYVILVLLLACRLIAFRHDLVNDLSDPARAFGFFTFVAATNVIGARLVGDGHREVVVGLLAVSSLAWLFLGYLIPAMVAHRPRTDPALRGVNGSWFIWVVASQSIAVLAATLEPQVDVGRRELALVAVFSWSVGLFLYGTVGVLVVVRLLMFKIQPVEATPPYWVAMGATAISVVAGSKIVEMAKAPMVTATSALIAGLAVLFWAFGTWLIPALLAVGYWRHFRHRVPLVYEPSMWSIVFPLGMYGVGSAYLGEVDDLPIVKAIGHAEIWVALAVWAIVFGAMLHHLARTVFRADPPR